MRTDSSSIIVYKQILMIKDDIRRDIDHLKERSTMLQENLLCLSKTEEFLILLSSVSLIEVSSYGFIIFQLLPLFETSGDFSNGVRETNLYFLETTLLECFPIIELAFILWCFSLLTFCFIYSHSSWIFLMCTSLKF